MTTQDAIFWYTGWFVWAAFAVALAIGLLFGAAVAVVRVYQASKYWKAVRLILQVPVANDREWARVRFAFAEANRAAGMSFTEDQWKTWLIALQATYKEY